MIEDFKNKLIITTDRGSILDDEFQEECDFVKNLIGIKRFAVRSDFKSTWYNRGKNRKYKIFKKADKRRRTDKENFKFKDKPMFYVKQTLEEKPYHIPAHFCVVDNKYVEDRKFEGRKAYSEGPYYLKHSHISAFIDGELEDEIGYDILNYVHGHVPMMKRLGDYVKGYVFHVDEYNYKYEPSVPHKIFNVVKGRRLIMFPILFYLAETSTYWESDFMESNVRRAKEKGEEFEGSVRVDHTCYAKADNQVSRDEIEIYKEEGRVDEHDKYPFIVDLTNIRYKDLATIKTERHIATIGIVKEKTNGHLGNFMQEREQEIRKQLKENGGKTNYEIENDPVWCEEMKRYVPRKAYTKMKELNEFDWKHINWISDAEIEMRKRRNK